VIQAADDMIERIPQQHVVFTEEETVFPAHITDYPPEPAPHTCRFCGYWGSYSEGSMEGRCFGLSITRVGEDQFRIIRRQSGIHPITDSWFSCGEWKPSDELKPTLATPQEHA
jgi:hypothetical protein